MDKIKFEQFVRDLVVKRAKGVAGIGQAPVLPEPSLASKLLARKIDELLADPPAVDQYGQRIGEMTYSKAFGLAMAQNPELARAYWEEILPKRRFP